jgi:eukaryotic-like serine/threonine-protein kinase
MKVERLASALADRYRIERELGAGGMATVYLAYDIRHERKVALKLLKPELAAVLGAERFVQEIRTTAALQHPHILPLFDSGTADGFLFYVMPFIDGETLRSKLDRETQLGIDEAVKIATDVADALHYAHTQGVIHRDIKPENILLHNGRPMVADFGIALAVSAAAGGRMTETGLSLGTPHYMSPEQATAEKEISARSDVYSLASVLYEMLTGQPPHLGGSAQQIIMKIITETPQPAAALRKAVPPHVSAALDRALEKLPADRFASAKEFLEALRNPAFTHGVSGAMPAHRAAHGVDGWRVGLGAVAAIAVAWALWSNTGRDDREAGALSTFALALPAGQELLAPGGTRIAFAPDGRSFVYVGVGRNRPQLWLRRLDDLSAVPIEGSEGATSPSFSPDGQEVAFTTLAPFQLKVASVSGGHSRVIMSDDASGGGAAWVEDGYLYADVGDGLGRVRPDGTDRKLVVAFDTTDRETGVAWPSALPGGRGVLMRIRRGTEPTSNYRIVVLDLRDGSRKTLVQGLVAHYSPSGHLIWVAFDGRAYAQRFDLERLELLGKPIQVWSGSAIGGFGAADLAVSPAGDVLYTSGAERKSIADLVWVDRRGNATRVDSTAGETGLVSSLALSPDNARVALEILRPTGAADLTRIWVKRLTGGGATQLVTQEPAISRLAGWSPDGSHILYSSAGVVELRRRKADGSGSPETMLHVPRGVISLTVNRRGTMVMQVTGSSAARKDDLAMYTPGVDSAPVMLIGTDADETSPAFSPDGKWLAYTSDESGRPEVYVVPFPDVTSQKVLASTEGGGSPRWNPNGKELFYASLSGSLMSVEVRTATTAEMLSTTRLFSASNFATARSFPVYDVSADGRRFLMLDITAQGADASGSLVMTHNLGAELSRRLPR